MRNPGSVADISRVRREEMIVTRVPGAISHLGPYACETVWVANNRAFAGGSITAQRAGSPSRAYARMAAG